MLLSLSNRFVFIANVKTGSSAIESALGRHAEFSVTQTKFGKHDDLSAISRKFPWVKKYVPFDQFFVFGVMRDPVDRIISLYNFHTRTGFDGKPHSTKELTFDQFLADWCVRSWQARAQGPRFSDSYGRFRVSHVVQYEKLAEEFPKICRHLGLKAELPKRNVSPIVIRRRDLTSEQIAQIEARYVADKQFLKQAPRTI